MSIPDLPDDPAAGRTRRHLGGLVTIRAAAGDTNGSLAVVEERTSHGYATPPHVHHREDETLFVIDGVVEYTVDDRVATATAGEAAFLPRGRPHHFTVVSDEAHFLVIITPGGFERFFGEVSPPATAADAPGTRFARMVTSAAALGSTVFTDGETALAAAKVLTTATDLTQITGAYRTIEQVVAGAGPLPAAIDTLIGLLGEVAAERAGEHPVHGRALILLGIITERDPRTGPPVRAAMRRVVRQVDPEWPESTVLAAAYLFAHFPADADAITAALGATTLPEPDLARLRRCLRRPDPASPATVNGLGRVWPSPATWTLNNAERDVDRGWRERLGLTPELIAELWQAETTALLAFMGARAEHAVERSHSA